MHPNSSPTSPLHPHQEDIVYPLYHHLLQKSSKSAHNIGSFTTPFCPPYLPLFSLSLFSILSTLCTPIFAPYPPAPYIKKNQKENPFLRHILTFFKSASNLQNFLQPFLPFPYHLYNGPSLLILQPPQLSHIPYDVMQPLHVKEKRKNRDFLPLHPKSQSTCT